MSDQQATTERQTDSPPKRMGLAALAGFLMIFVGIAVYMVMADDPYARWTGWPAFVGMGIGAVLGVLSIAKDRRWWVRGLGGLNVVLLAMFAYAFYFWAQLPDTQSFAALESAPDFTLVNHEGRNVNLKSELTKGPVLLVFYRGFW